MEVYNGKLVVFSQFYFFSFFFFSISCFSSNPSQNLRQILIQADRFYTLSWYDSQLEFQTLEYIFTSSTKSSMSTISSCVFTAIITIRSRACVTNNKSQCNETRRIYDTLTLRCRNNFFLVEITNNIILEYDCFC
jgi:hypothetical protein